MLRRLAVRAKETVFVRYAFVGGVSFIVELSSLLAIYHYAHTSRETATAIAYWIGLLLAFVLQKLVAFRNYQREVKALTRQGLIYALLTIWNYAFTIAVVAIGGDKHIVLSRIAAQLIFSTWNFFLYKKVIFKQSTDLAV